MGQGKSKSANTVETATKSLIDVVNTSLTNCTSPINQNQALQITIGDGGIIDGSTFNFDQAASINFSCLQSVETTNALDTNMDTAITQTSNAVNGSVLLPSGSASAKNVTSYVTQLGTAIKNAYTQNCVTQLNQNQLGTYTLGDGSIITGVDVNFKQTADTVLNCVQNNTTVNQAKTNLQTAIDQTSKSEVTGFPWIYVIIGIVIFLVIVAIVIGVIIFFVSRSVSKVATTGISELGKVSQTGVSATGQTLDNLTNVTGQVLTSEQFGKTVGTLGDTVGSLSSFIPAKGAGSALGKVTGGLGKK